MEASQVRVVQNTMAGNIAANQFTIADNVRLYLSTFTPTPNSTLSDFMTNRVAALDIADVPTTVGWLGGVDILGRALIILGELLVFTPAGTATFPILAGGWFITNAADTTLLAHGSFDDPVSFDTVLDTLIVKPSMYWDGLTNADAEFIDGP